MSNIVAFKDNELALIRRTVAKNCQPSEFDQFVHIAKAVGLDPLRRQIYAFVFGKDDDRRLTVVTGIDGYRAISDRNGNYRPADKVPHIEYDQTKESAANPLGIVRCEVTLYKFAHGGWHPVVGEAYWDEFVPLVASSEDVTWEDTGETWHDTGKPKRKKVIKPGAAMIVDPHKSGWVKSPRNQIAKCAEAQAHRKGWPNDFSGLEVQEEVDRRMTLDLTASEIADETEKQDRLARIGGPNLITIDWMDGGSLDNVPADKMLGKAMDFVRSCEGQPNTVAAWQDRNKASLKLYWGVKPSEALELKKEVEKAQAVIVEDAQLDIERDAIAALDGRKGKKQ